MTHSSLVRGRSHARALGIALVLYCWLGPAALGAGASFVVAPGASGVSGPGPVTTFTVEVERGLGASAPEVAQQVERRMFDHRAWGAGHHRSFQRVSTRTADIRFLLASPRTTDSLCAPIMTVGYWNCQQGSMVVLNHDRWVGPAPTYIGLVDAYRTLMVMHEFGHTLGHGHVGCPGSGALAPSMMQQGKGLDGCIRNPWPAPRAARLPSACTVTTRPTASPLHSRVAGEVRWVGVPTVVRFEARMRGRWQVVGATSVSSDGRFRKVVKAPAGFVRVAFSGTASRAPCRAIASR